MLQLGPAARVGGHEHCGTRASSLTSAPPTSSVASAGTRRRQRVAAVGQQSPPAPGHPQPDGQHAGDFAAESYHVQQPVTSGRHLRQQHGGRKACERRAEGGNASSDLERRILGLRSAEEVLDLAASAPELTAPAALAAVGRLAALAADRESCSAVQAAVQDHPCLPRLYSTIQPQCSQLPPQPLGRFLQHCVRLRLRPATPLLAAAAARLEPAVPALRPAEAVRAAWALTKLECSGASSLLGAIGAAAEQGVRSGRPWLAALDPSLLVMLLWTCSKAGHRSEALLLGTTRALAAAGRDGAALVAAPPLAALRAEQLSMLFYSLGSLRWAPDDEFLEDAAAAALHQLPAFNCQGLANTAWALSRLPPQHQAAAQPLAAALAGEAVRRMPSFKPRHFSMLVMAAADGAPFRDCRRPLLQAAGEHLAAAARQLDGRDLASVLSALATAGVEPPRASQDAAARRAGEVLGSTPTLSLAWLLWAWARAERWRPPRVLLQRVAAALHRRLDQLYCLPPADVATLAWSLAQLQCYSGALLADLAAVCRSMWERMDPQSMSVALHSFALQRFTPHELLDAAAEHLAGRLGEYTPQQVAVLLWSLGKLGVHPGRGLPGGGPCTQDGTPLMAAAAAYAVQHAGGGEDVGGGEAFTLQGLSMLLWAFATLEHHPGEELLQAAAQRLAAQLRRCEGLGPDAAADLLQATATSAWSMSQLRWPCEELFAATEAALPTLLAAAGNAPGGGAGRELHLSLSSLAFAAAKLRVRAAPPLLRRLLPCTAPHLGAFGGRELCQLLWAAAHAGVQPERALLDAAAARLAALLAQARFGSTPAEASLLCLAASALATLSYRADDALLHACFAAAAAAADELPVNLLAKLVWGVATVGHSPHEKELEAVAGSLYYRLSHSRGSRTVLHAADTVRLLWGLAVLQQYHHRLYRNVAFRAAALPDGVPAQPALRRLLREATVLHSCEHRLDVVAATAAAAILPAWMSSSQEQAEGQQQQQQQQEREQGGSEPAPAAALGLGGPPLPTQQELRADADAACEVLRRGGLHPALKQFSFGDYLILVEATGGSTGGGRGRRGQQVGVIPAGTAGRCAVNAPAQLLGSALVSQRVLSARGLPVVHATGDERQLLVLCRQLLTEGSS